MSTIKFRVRQQPSRLLGNATECLFTRPTSEFFSSEIPEIPYTPHRKNHLNLVKRINNITFCRANVIMEKQSQKLRLVQVQVAVTT